MMKHFNYLLLNSLQCMARVCRIRSTSLSCRRARGDPLPSRGCSAAPLPPHLPPLPSPFLYAPPPMTSTSPAALLTPLPSPLLMRLLLSCAAPLRLSPSHSPSSAARHLSCQTFPFPFPCPLVPLCYPYILPLTLSGLSTGGNSSSDWISTR